MIANVTAIHQSSNGMDVSIFKAIIQPFTMRKKKILYNRPPHKKKICKTFEKTNSLIYKKTIYEK